MCSHNNDYFLSIKNDYIRCKINTMVDKNILTKIITDKYICGHFGRFISDIDVFLLRLVCRQFRPIRPLSYDFAGFHDVIKLAAKTNNLPLLQFAHEYGQHSINSYIIGKAIKTDSINCVKYMLNHGVNKNVHSVDTAARFGAIKCLKYFNLIGMPVISVGNLAAFNNKLECLKYIISRGYRPSAAIMSSIAGNGAFDCLKYLHEHGVAITADVVAEATTFECLEYAHKAISVMPDKACITAAKNGRLDCLKYAHENGGKFTNSIIKHAARAGSSPCLQYLHEHGCPLTVKVCRNAAAAGSLPCLQYAYELGGFNNIGDFIQHATGSLDCLKYIYSKLSSIDITISLCEWTASKNVECLKFARSLGYHWDESTCENAVLSGKLDCLKYAHENGCPWGDNIAIIASKVDSVECLKYVIHNGCKITSELFRNFFYYEISYYLRSIVHKFHQSVDVNNFYKLYKLYYE